MNIEDHVGKGSKVVGFRADPELAKEIEELAAEHNMTVSELLRKAIRFYLHHKPRLDTRLSRLEIEVEDTQRELSELRQRITEIANRLEELENKLENAIRVLAAAVRVVIENAKMKDEHRVKARKLLAQL